MSILGGEKIDVPGDLRINPTMSVGELMNIKTAAKMTLNTPINIGMNDAQIDLGLSGLINQNNALNFDDCFQGPSIAF